MCLGLSSGIAVFSAGLAILTLMWQFTVVAALYLLVFIYFWNIEGKYRTFEWYRNNKTSAKSGFITGFSLSWWGLLFLVENILMASLTWQIALWSGALFVGGLVLVYIRSGRTVADDIKIILNHGKR